MPRSLRLVSDRPAAPAQAPKDIGTILFQRGSITAEQAGLARLHASRRAATLEQIFRHDMGVSEDALGRAAAQAGGINWYADLGADVFGAVDAQALTRFAADIWLKLGCIPLTFTGSATLIASGRPDLLAQARAEFEPVLGPVSFVLAPMRLIEERVLDFHQDRLARAAEATLPEHLSCRTMTGYESNRAASAAFLIAVLVFISAPVWTFLGLFFLGTFVLVVNALTKLLMIASELRARPNGSVAFKSIRGQKVVPLGRLPVVTVFVPLFREKDIAPRLVKRLGALRYPRSLLDICLIVEERDTDTREALSGADLLSNMRVIIVPHRPLRTKPRAMNYALNVARGSIIGIYDAEDAPDPDQILKIVSRFQTAGPNVACLQGRLDFYNARTNWMARCFTIEYASWFRVMLPAFARVGFPVPLGGTTVFMRRDALEKLGAWDAFNVTEDADLGIRLARAGYRTELVDTVTREEANCRPIAWIKQRSRWLKGYLITYIVHMRDPVALFRDLGPVGFAGFQTLFLGTLIGFLMAPLLLSFWLVSLGLPHPAETVLGRSTLWVFWGMFVAAELTTILLGVLAARKTGHGNLIAWVPTVHLYFPLASLAMLKAVYEVVTNPFYWDKTSHGHFDAGAAGHDPGPPPQ